MLAGPPESQTPLAGVRLTRSYTDFWARPKRRIRRALPECDEPMNDARVSGWKGIAGWAAAGIMAAIWLVAGVWKLSGLSQFQLMLTQMLFPVSLSLPAAVAVAVCEVFAGVLLLRPAWRRWGAYLSVALLAVFMAYVGYHYEALRGEDCSCFPWIERAVGPAFFWSDAAMVAVALAAAWFAPASSRQRGAIYALAGVLAVSFGALAVDQLKPVQASDVPAEVEVDGKPFPLREGRVFIYFFNPTCLHCLDVGITMSEYDWNAELVGVPTQDFQFAGGFLQDSGLQQMKLTSELDKLKEVFPFEDVPYAVAVEDGRVKAQLRFFEEPEFQETLREQGFIR